MHTPMYDYDSPERAPSRWEASAEYLLNLEWLRPVGITLAAVVLINLFVVRPLQEQVLQLRRELQTMQTSVADLTGMNDHVWQTNNLLSMLEEQASRLTTAAGAVEQVHLVERELAVVAQVAERTTARLSASRVALEQLAEIELELIQQADQLAQTKSALTAIQQFQDDVLGCESTLERAQAVIAHQLSLTDSIDALRQQIVAAEEDLERVESLTQRVASLADTAQSAQAAVDGLVNLQERLAAGEPGLAQAQVVVDGLLSLQGTLSDERRIDLAQADRNLQGLILLEEALVEETSRVADAVLMLELLADFQDEFHFQIGRLEGMQRDLTELMMLESTVARTVRMLEPLAELTNLRRLDDQDVREAARIILDRRGTRLSSRPVDAPPLIEMDGPAPVERLVPIPPGE